MLADAGGGGFAPKTLCGGALSVDDADGGDYEMVATEVTDDDASESEGEGDDGGEESDDGGEDMTGVGREARARREAQEREACVERTRLEAAKDVLADLDMNSTRSVIDIAQALLTRPVPPDIDADGLEGIVHTVHHIWCSPLDSRQAIELRTHAFLGQVRQIDPDTGEVVCVDDDGTEAVMTRYKQWMDFVELLKYKAGGGGDSVVMEEDRYRDVLTLMHQVGIQVYNAYHYMQYANAFRMCSQNAAPKMKDLNIDTLCDPHEVEEKSDVNRAIEWYLAEVKRRCLRRHGENLYQPVYVDKHYYTRFSRRMCSIKEFIYLALIPRSNNVEIFNIMTERISTMVQVERYLTNGYDVPTLNMDGNLFSYENGVWDTKELKFYPYRPGPDGVCAANIRSDKTSVNYIAQKFDYDRYELLATRLDPKTGREYKDYSRIPTPNIEKIAKTQKWPKEVIDWMYIMLGRLFYEVGEYDNWQIFMFCMGLGNTGKSTLYRLMTMFFQMKDVGVMANEGRQSFQLQNLYKKRVYFCFDMNEKMNLESTRWNSMVTGEPTTVEILYKENVDLPRWTVPGAWAGNAFPPFDDDGGQTSRRFFLFLFNVVLKKVDTSLFSKMLTEMAAFMYKATCMYRAKVLEMEKNGNDGIWDTRKGQTVVPQYFHDAKNKLQARSNPLLGFLNRGRVATGAQYHCTYAELRAAFFTWAAEDGVDESARKMTKQRILSSLKRRGIRVMDARVSTPEGYEEKYKGQWLSGVRLLQEDEVRPVGMPMDNDDPADEPEDVLGLNRKPGDDDDEFEGMTVDMKLAILRKRRMRDGGGGGAAAEEAARAEREPSPKRRRRAAGRKRGRDDSDSSDSSDDSDSDDSHAPKRGRAARRKRRRDGDDSDSDYTPGRKRRRGGIDAG